MRVLIARSDADAAPMAEALAARGIDAMSQPLLDILPIADAAVPLDGVQAVLVTSRNGARALAAATARRDVALFAVGDATAGRARELGFARVESAAGDAAALAALVAARLDPAAGPVLHASGAEVAGNLAGALARHGFELRRAVLYRAVPVAALDPAVREMLSRGGIDAVLLFSPRSAAILLDLVADAALTGRCRSMAAVCLSAAVADKVVDTAWRTLSIAQRPDAASMIAAVEALKAAN